MEIPCFPQRTGLGFIGSNFFIRRKTLVWIYLIDCCFDYVNSNLIPLLEGLCISNPCRFDVSMFDFLPEVDWLCEIFKIPPLEGSCCLTSFRDSLIRSFVSQTQLDFSKWWNRYHHLKVFISTTYYLSKDDLLHGIWREQLNILRERARCTPSANLLGWPTHY